VLGGSADHAFEHAPVDDRGCHELANGANPEERLDLATDFFVTPAQRDERGAALF
jgi:hypothetical protein